MSLPPMISYLTNLSNNCQTKCFQCQQVNARWHAEYKVIDHSTDQLRSISSKMSFLLLSVLALNSQLTIHAMCFA